MTYLGRISYAWYLWHWPCLVAARQWHPQTMTVEEADPPAGDQTRSGTDSGAGAGEARASATSLPPPGREVTRTTPAQARADQVRLPGCLLGFAGTEIDPSCVYGDRDASTVVVAIGDSHLAHWFPALDRTARQRHWRLYLWAMSACAYASVPQWLEPYHRVYTECATWRRGVLERVAALPRVDAVVIGRTSSYLSLLTDSDGHRLDAAAAAAAGAGQTMVRAPAGRRVSSRRR